MPAKTPPDCPWCEKTMQSVDNGRFQCHNGYCEHCEDEELTPDEADNIASNRAERAYMDFYTDFHGGSGTMSIAEAHARAWQEHRETHRRD